MTAEIIICPECKSEAHYDFLTDYYFCACGWRDISRPLTFNCKWCGEIGLDEDGVFIFQFGRWDEICQKCYNDSYLIKEGAKNEF